VGWISQAADHKLQMGLSRTLELMYDDIDNRNPAGAGLVEQFRQHTTESVQKMPPVQQNIANARPCHIIQGLEPRPVAARDGSFTESFVNAFCKLVDLEKEEFSDWR
jgi:hypothetical protein